MKWMIASDIHGSALCCEKMLERFEAERAERLLLLGDLLYHGPRNALPGRYDPKQVAPMLNRYRDRILAVRGNCDAEIDQAVLDFPIMADYCLISDADTVLFATHGHLFSEENLPPLRRGDILLHGHTHVPVCSPLDGFVCLNPGSVAIPKGGSTNSYMTMENGLFSWKDLDGNEFLFWDSRS